MLNEHFGLGKKNRKSPAKKHGGGLLSKLDDFRSSVSSTTSSRPMTPSTIPGSPLSISSKGIDSDNASMTSSEGNFVVRPLKPDMNVEDKENRPSPLSNGVPRSPDLLNRSGTIVRVAAHWSGIKESLQKSSPSPIIEPSTPLTTTNNKLKSPFADARPKQLLGREDDGNQSSGSAVSPKTKRPPPRPQNHKEQVVEVKKAEPVKKLTQLPSVRLVHPSLAAIPGTDRKAERVVELGELLKQSDNEEVVKIKNPQPKKKPMQNESASKLTAQDNADAPIIHAWRWFSSSIANMLRLLIGSYHVNGAPGTGSLLDGIVALVRLLVLAYLVYCVWLLFGLIADVIQAICWPLKVVARFIEWSLKK